MASPAHPGQGESWYELLGLSPSASAAEIAAAVELLSRRAAALANTAPERSQRLRETSRAIKRDLLSGPEARERYDRSLLPPDSPPTPIITDDGPALPGPASPWPVPATPGPGGALPGPPGPPAPTLGEALGPAAVWAQEQGRRFRRFLQAGWTCANCGHGAMPGERFCVRCGQPIAVPGTSGRPDAQASAGAPAAAPAPATAASPAQATACPTCGLVPSSSDRFCRRCGTPRR